ncbi:MAG: tyrosine-type recombinase/integrase [Oscillospiraceae bacterium]|nr:tyrosine-type recombinase/integrase [Oscillospiraceae bacterium]
MVTEKERQRFQDGIFKPYFEKFIAYKRSKGEKVAHSAITRMKGLNDALNSYGTLNITQEMAEEILAPNPAVSDVTRYERINHLRQFSAFLTMLGIECYRIPKRYARPVRCQFRPYIFSDEEILRLINVVDNLRRWEHRERNTEIYPILLRLLIGTGIRISEALALRRSDIFCNDGVLNIVNSKNGVSRYVPMADSLNSAVRQYIAGNADGEFLFNSGKSRGAYSYVTIRAMFRKFCVSAEIFRQDGKTPNIHSLRHTFCSKSLEQMLATGMNLYTAVPILAAYVGHVDFRDTESYIHFTESSYKELLEKQEPLRKIIPEVNDDEQ